MADSTALRVTASKPRKRRADSIRAEEAFRARLDKLGATLLEPEWLGNGKPHLVRCSAGHVSSPRPDNVNDGQGICGSARD